MVECNDVEVVVLCQVGPRLEIHPAAEDLFGDEVEVVFGVPSPDPLPLFPRVDVEGVEDHDEGGGAAGLGF